MSTCINIRMINAHFKDYLFKQCFPPNRINMKFGWSKKPSLDSPASYAFLYTVRFIYDMISWQVANRKPKGALLLPQFKASLVVFAIAARMLDYQRNLFVQKKRHCQSYFHVVSIPPALNSPLISRVRQHLIAVEGVFLVQGTFRPNIIVFIRPEARMVRFWYVQVWAYSFVFILVSQLIHYIYKRKVCQ